MYKTLAELYGAYQTGVVNDPLVLDNDNTSVRDSKTEDHVFEMHPEDLLRQALGMLNIPFIEC